MTSFRVRFASVATFLFFARVYTDQGEVARDFLKASQKASLCPRDPTHALSQEQNWLKMHCFATCTIAG